LSLLEVTGLRWLWHDSYFLYDFKTRNVRAALARIMDKRYPDNGLSGYYLIGYPDIIRSPSKRYHLVTNLVTTLLTSSNRSLNNPLTADLPEAPWLGRARTQMLKLQNVSAKLDPDFQLDLDAEVDFRNSFLTGAKPLRTWKSISGLNKKEHPRREDGRVSSTHGCPSSRIASWKPQTDVQSSDDRTIVCE
jgi:hypothetical protein